MTVTLAPQTMHTLRPWGGPSREDIIPVPERQAQTSPTANKSNHHPKYDRLQQKPMGPKASHCCHPGKSTERAVSNPASGTTGQSQDTEPLELRYWVLDHSQLGPVEMGEGQHPPAAQRHVIHTR